MRGEFDRILEEIANDLPDSQYVELERLGYGLINVDVEK
jgi:hypothetical protein